MTFETIKNKWAGFVNRMNRMGVPVPTVRDPKTGRGSITATLVVASAGLFAICIGFMLATSIGKWAGFFVLTDAAFAQVRVAADYSWQFLMTAIGAYLGRFMQKGSDETPEPIPASPVTKVQKQEAAQKADDPDRQ